MIEASSPFSNLNVSMPDFTNTQSPYSMPGGFASLFLFSGWLSPSWLALVILLVVERRLV
jgi:hypothetical protein